MRVSTAYIEQPNKSHQCYCTQLEGRIRDLEKDMLNLRLGQVESQIASLKQKNSIHGAEIGKNHYLSPTFYRNQVSNQQTFIQPTTQHVIAPPPYLNRQLNVAPALYMQQQRLPSFSQFYEPRPAQTDNNSNNCIAVNYQSCFQTHHTESPRFQLVTPQINPPPYVYRHPIQVAQQIPTAPNYYQQQQVERPSMSQYKIEQVLSDSNNSIAVRHPDANKNIQEVHVQRQEVQQMPTAQNYYQQQQLQPIERHSIPQYRNGQHSLSSDSNNSIAVSYPIANQLSYNVPTQQQHKQINQASNLCLMMPAYQNEKLGKSEDLKSSESQATN